MLKLQDMVRVLPLYILAAFLPALMVAGLYFFYHIVASQLAQQGEINLKNPSAYHYDISVLGFMVLGCGLIGLPSFKWGPSTIPPCTLRALLF
ncbi:hypothetical protein AAC387_Pa05g1822 [Persea americana]